jgi:hypothetical protein
MRCFALTLLSLLAAAAEAASPPLKGVGSISTRAQCSDIGDLDVSWYYNWKVEPDCPVTSRYARF